MIVAHICVQAASTNHRNFCTLLNFRISAGDIILRDHLQSAARNASSERQMELQLEYLFPFPFTPIALLTVWTWQLWLYSRRWASVTWLVLWSDCPSSFFAHRKRQKKFEEAIQNTQPESNVLKLKDLCRTRWIEWIDALDQIKKLYSSIVACFENISAEGSRMRSPDSVTDTSTLLLVITRTDSSVLLWLLMSIYSISGVSQWAFKRRLKT